ncbi:unnamed protein product [Amoebophrya sp. A25]|nr:unnamed protein product [Amoebophrya sp. A25]|eukprot:GSA25T00008991001.1
MQEKQELLDEYKPTGETLASAAAVSCEAPETRGGENAAFHSCQPIKKMQEQHKNAESHRTGVAGASVEKMSGGVQQGSSSRSMARRRQARRQKSQLEEHRDVPGVEASTRIMACSDKNPRIAEDGSGPDVHCVVCSGCARGEQDQQLVRREEDKEKDRRTVLACLPAEVTARWKQLRSLLRCILCGEPEAEKSSCSGEREETTTHREAARLTDEERTLRAATNLSEALCVTFGLFVTVQGVQMMLNDVFDPDHVHAETQTRVREKGAIFILLTVLNCMNSMKLMKSLFVTHFLNHPVDNRDSLYVAQTLLFWSVAIEAELLLEKSREEEASNAQQAEAGASAQADEARMSALVVMGKEAENETGDERKMNLDVMARLIMDQEENRSFCQDEATPTADQIKRQNRATDVAMAGAEEDRCTDFSSSCEPTKTNDSPPIPTSTDAPEDEFSSLELYQQSRRRLCGWINSYFGAEIWLLIDLSRVGQKFARGVYLSVREDLGFLIESSPRVFCGEDDSRDTVPGSAADVLCCSENEPPTTTTFSSPTSERDREDGEREAIDVLDAGTHTEKKEQSNKGRKSKAWKRNRAKAEQFLADQEKRAAAERGQHFFRLPEVDIEKLRMNKPFMDRYRSVVQGTSNMFKLHALLVSTLVVLKALDVFVYDIVVLEDGHLPDLTS